MPQTYPAKDNKTLKVLINNKNEDTNKENRHQAYQSILNNLMLLRFSIKKKLDPMQC